MWAIAVGLLGGEVFQLEAKKNHASFRWLSIESQRENTLRLQIQMGYYRKINLLFNLTSHKTTPKLLRTTAASTTSSVVDVPDADADVVKASE